MKYLNSALIFAVLFTSFHSIFAQSSTVEGQVIQSYTSVPVYTDNELISRINSMQNRIIPPRFDRVVKSYIGTYTVRKRAHTEKMLGRTNLYFPLFEKYAAEMNLPYDIKYLSVVESALNPRALSRSGAAGLWQFMPATGREYGLKINSLVDERRDPNKSTAAAMKYLSRLYKRYGDWALALAAYNGGPGRVNRAIKRGRSKNFWRIRKYLPRETRAYVPAFVAASYVVNFYHEHNLLPVNLEAEKRDVESAKVYKRISFQMIEEVTGTPMQVIKDLNPSYKQYFLPTSRTGNFLSLPRVRMAALLNHLGRPDERLNRMISDQINRPEYAMFNNNFVRSTYVVQGGETFVGLAKKFNCGVRDIKQWNNIRGDYMYKGQTLRIFSPKISGVDLLPVPLPEQTLYAKPSSSDPMALPKSEPKINKTIKKYKFPKISRRDKKYIYHQVKRRETLMSIAEKYHDVSLDDILKLNKIKYDDPVKPGTKIIIRKK